MMGAGSQKVIYELASQVVLLYKKLLLLGTHSSICVGTAAKS